jgi:hypothetical protein
MTPEFVLLSLEAFRLAEMIAGVTCFIVLIWRTIRHWRGLSHGQKLFHVGLEFILLASLWDVFNLWVHDIHFSYRGVPYSLGILLLFVYILEPKRSYIKRVGIEPYESIDQTDRKEDCE